MDTIDNTNVEWVDHEQITFDSSKQSLMEILDKSNINLIKALKLGSGLVRLSIQYKNESNPYATSKELQEDKEILFNQNIIDLKKKIIDFTYKYQELKGIPPPKPLID